jgi:hypothetical protein
MISRTTKTTATILRQPPSQKQTFAAIHYYSVRLERCLSERIVCAPHFQLPTQSSYEFEFAANITCAAATTTSKTRPEAKSKNANSPVDIRVSPFSSYSKTARRKIPGRKVRAGIFKNPNAILVLWCQEDGGGAFPFRNTHLTVQAHSVALGCYRAPKPARLKPKPRRNAKADTFIPGTSTFTKSNQKNCS